MTSHTSMLMTSLGAAAQDHEILVVAICGLQTHAHRVSAPGVHARHADTRGVACTPRPVPWLIRRHEPATTQALQEARLAGAQVAFDHHLDRQLCHA